MDVSKQAASSVFIHFWNIGLSILFANTILDGVELSNGDECSFYFLSFLFDTILGVFFVWVLLRLIRRVALYFKIDSISIQGFYGEPPSIHWYFQQLFCFLVAIIISKIVLSLIMYSIASSLQYVGSYIFSPLELNPKMELVVVMIVCPCVLNVVQYWLLDNFLADGGDGPGGSRCRDYEFLGKTHKKEKRRAACFYTGSHGFSQFFTVFHDFSHFFMITFSEVATAEIHTKWDAESTPSRERNQCFMLCDAVRWWMPVCVTVSSLLIGVTIIN